MSRPEDFSESTKQSALCRQCFLCGSCGEHIASVDSTGQSAHFYGEAAQAHHIRPIRFGGTSSLENCVILCQSCHYSAHEGGSYRTGTVIGDTDDYPYYHG